MVLCKCGCGEEVKPGNTWICGHNGRGVKRTREQQKKMNDSRKGFKHTEETKKKISRSHIGIKPTKETRQKISDSNKGYKHTEEQKKKNSESHKGKNNPSWRGGISFGKYCSLFNNRFKEQIRKLYNRRCFLCGKSEEENDRKHDVHHVNYDKDCLCGSVCEFVPLCSSCHGKTGHNRRYWEDTIMCYMYPERYFMVGV